MSNAISIDHVSDTCLIRFTNPDRRNPLSSSVILELHSILDNLERSTDVSTLVFTGSSDVFASGADLREISALTVDTAPAFSELGQSLMSRIDGLKQKTAAAINGFCFGGALDLALACDHRVASENATFAHPGAGLGIITGWGGTQRLPRLVGRANALEMFFTASPISAERALMIGLVDSVSDDIFNNEILRLDLDVLGER